MNPENVNNFNLYFYIIAVAFIIISLIFPITEAKAYENITPAETKQYIDKDLQNVTLLDVRTPEEYRNGHIPKSINIPLQILNKQTSERNLSKDMHIIVYCQSGIRSKKAVKILDELGYNRVYFLGGIKDWPYELEK